MAANEQELSTIERGNIYFIYQPKVEQEEAKGLGDLQRFYIVLSPHGKKLYRRLVVGEKRLPEIEGGDRKNWGFVDMVAPDAGEIERELEASAYQTKTRGERHEPAARAAGEGVYSLVRHGNHTHLLYALELPKDVGEPQRELNIEAEGSYIISVKNPEAPSPPRAGLSPEQQTNFPRELQGLFHGRKFLPVDPPDFLDYEGAEFLLIGAADDISEELGLDLHPQDETEQTAEVFRDLRLKKSKQPVEPLLKGKWK